MLFLNLFVKHIKSEGLVVICNDSEVVSEVSSIFKKRFLKVNKTLNKHIFKIFNKIEIIGFFLIFNNFLK